MLKEFFNFEHFWASYITFFRSWKNPVKVSKISKRNNLLKNGRIWKIQAPLNFYGHSTSGWCEKNICSPFSILLIFSTGAPSQSGWNGQIFNFLIFFRWAHFHIPITSWTFQKNRPVKWKFRGTLPFFWHTLYNLTNIRSRYIHTECPFWRRLLNY